MAIVDEESVQHLPHPSLSDEKRSDEEGQGEPVSVRQRAEWSEFDQRWGKEKELQQETDMEFFRWTQDGQALPAPAAGGAWQRGGVAVSVTVQQPGAGVGGEGERKPEEQVEDAAGDKSEKGVVLLHSGRNGWADPEVPLGASGEPTAAVARRGGGGKETPPSPVAAAERRSASSRRRSGAH